MHQGIIELIKSLIEPMSHDERIELYRQLDSEYCRECGTKQPSVGQCQCWNDE